MGKMSMRNATWVSGNASAGTTSWVLIGLLVACVLFFGLVSAEAASTETFRLLDFAGEYYGAIVWGPIPVSSGMVIAPPATTVILSSCSVQRATSGDCYFNCVNPNGTPVKPKGDYVTCPK